VILDEKATLINLHTTLMAYQDTIRDRVHPNAKGAGLMAKAVYKALTGKEYPGPAPEPAETVVTNSGKPDAPPPPSDVLHP